MGYHTFVATEVLTASNVMTYLMKQANIVCTSATRPASPATGEIIFETDTLLLQMYTGAAWVPHGRQNGPLGLVAQATGPGSLTDYSTGTTAVTVSPTMVNGRSYRVTGSVLGTQVTNTGAPICKLFIGGVEGPTARLLTGETLATSQSASGTAVWIYQATSTAATACLVQVGSSAASFRVAANATQIAVEDIGV